MGASERLTLSDELRATTLGDLLDRAYAGPLELRDADGHLVAEVHGRWLTLGSAGAHGQRPDDAPPVTTDELLRRLNEAKRVHDARGGERRAG